MSIRNQFFTSFIKGIAQTTGSLTVLSVAAILWQLYTRENIIIQTSKPENQTEETDQNDLECSFIDCNNTLLTTDSSIQQGTENENTTNKNTKINFKKIFDKL